MNEWERNMLQNQGLASSMFAFWYVNALLLTGLILVTFYNTSMDVELMFVYKVFVIHEM